MAKNKDKKRAKLAAKARPTRSSPPLPIWIRCFASLAKATEALRAAVARTSHPTPALAAVVDMRDPARVKVTFGTRAFWLRISSGSTREALKTAFEQHEDPADLCALVVDENGQDDPCALSYIESRYSYLT